MLTARCRYDHFASIEIFVHRMPSNMHEVITRKLSAWFGGQLASLCSTEQEKEFQAMVADLGSGDIKARQGKEFHQPDAYFACAKSTPVRGVALEVAYSQERDRIPQLAEFYLGEQSKRMCQVVVGIDCDCRGGTKRATLLVFRRHDSDSTGKKIACREQVSIFTQAYVTTTYGRRTFDERTARSFQATLYESPCSISRVPTIYHPRCATRQSKSRSRRCINSSNWGKHSKMNSTVRRREQVILQTGRTVTTHENKRRDVFLIE